MSWFNFRRWTLIDWLIALTIAGIGVAIVWPHWQIYRYKQRLAVMEANLFTVKLAVDQFAEENYDTFPLHVKETLPDGSTLVDFMPQASWPVNPFTDQKEAVRNMADLRGGPLQPGVVYYWRFFGGYMVLSIDEDDRLIELNHKGDLVRLRPEEVK